MTIKATTLRKTDDLMATLALIGGPADAIVAGIWGLARMVGLVKGRQVVAVRSAAERKAERVLAECRKGRKAR